MDYPLSFQDRLEVIFSTNPTYGCRIIDFISKNPEFESIAYLFPLTDKLICFNKDTDPKCMFEFLLYYIAEAGVNANYGHQQYLIIRQNFNNLNLSNIQPKKKQVYIDINNYLLKRNIKPNELKLEDIVDLKNNVKGVGDGCLTFLYTIYDTDKVTLPNYSDIGFKKGYQKFYKLDYRPTKAEIIKKSKGWTDVHLVNVLMQQCYTYL